MKKKFVDNLLQIPILRHYKKEGSVLGCEPEKVTAGGLTLGVVQVHSLVEFKLLVSCLYVGLFVLHFIHHFICYRKQWVSL